MPMGSLRYIIVNIHIPCNVLRLCVVQDKFIAIFKVRILFKTGR